MPDSIAGRLKRPCGLSRRLNELTSAACAAVRVCTGTVAGIDEGAGADAGAAAVAAGAAAAALPTINSITARNCASLRSARPPRGGIPLLLPAMARLTSASMPACRRGRHCAASPGLGAPSTPVPWQATQTLSKTDLAPSCARAAGSSRQEIATKRVQGFMFASLRRRAARCEPAGAGASFCSVLSCTWVGVPGLALWQRLQFSTDQASSPLWQAPQN
jgi:hypothetical protein